MSHDVTLLILIPPEKKKCVLLIQPHVYLVGGFNPSEKYQSNWIISPSRGENKKYLKPPASYSSQMFNFKHSS